MKYEEYSVAPRWLVVRTCSTDVMANSADCNKNGAANAASSVNVAKNADSSSKIDVLRRKYCAYGSHAAVQSEEASHAHRFSDNLIRRLSAPRLTAELTACMFVGAFLGYTLDKWLGVLPLFLVCGSMFGFVGGMFNAYRDFVRLYKKERDASAHDEH